MDISETVVIGGDQTERMKTTVVNLRHSKYDIYIGRGSPFGNPFRIGADGTRSEVIKKYRSYLLGNEELITRVRAECRGKTLGCFCKPMACHGDVIAEIADTNMLP